MLTARSEEIDTIIGLELGADDYLGKPFNPRELSPGSGPVLRRHQAGPRISKEPPGSFIFEGWTPEREHPQLTNPEEVRVAVTGAEFDLLKVLCRAPRTRASRDALLDLTQGRSRRRSSAASTS